MHQAKLQSKSKMKLPWNKSELPQRDTLALQFATDSNFNQKAKNQMKEADSMYQSAIKQVFSPKLGLGGSARIEAYATNAQNPLQLNEKQYLRADINTNVVLMGLPFKTGFYYTTESQSLYNTNKIYFSFDAYAFKEKLHQSWKAQNDALMRKHKIREYNLAKLDAAEKSLQNKLDQLKTQIPTETLLQSEAEKQKMEWEQKAQKETEVQKAKYPSKADSLRNTKENSLRDSLSIKRQGLQDGVSTKADSGLINKYQRMEKQLAELKEQKAKLEALQQNDTLNQILGFLRNPKQEKEAMMHSAQGKMKMALATDRFDMGAINPVYSEFTSQGILLRGLDWQVSNSRFFGGLSAGRTTLNLPHLFTRSKPKFGRNFGIVTAGIGSKEKNFIALTAMGAKDAKVDSIDLSNPPIKNTVLSLEGKYELLKPFTLEAEVAKSNYQFNNGAEHAITTVNDQPISTSIWDQANLAYKGSVTYINEKNTEASIQLRRVNPGFKSIGNLFLRTNIQEHEFKLKQAFYKQRIKLSLFYKENRDNVYNLLETTNRMKGYGGTLNVSIPKYPTLTVGYMPYEQGNNHPDSLLQTNNQFSMLFANLAYTKNMGAWNLILSGSATQSEMEIRNANIFTTSTLYQSSLMGQYKNKFQSALSYSLQTTNPGIDSLNSSSIQYQMKYALSRKIRLGTQFNGSYFKSGGFKYEGGLSLAWQVAKKSALKLEGNVGKINQIWGFNHANMINGRVSWFVLF